MKALWGLVDRIKGGDRLSDNLRREKRRRRQRFWRISIYAFGFFCLAGLCWAIGEIILLKELGKTSTKWRVIYDLLSTLAPSFFVLGFVSIVYEFRDFTEYVEHILNQAIFSRTGLLKRTPDELRQIREDVDDKLFGTEAVKDPNSIYSFITRKSAKFIHSSYRDDFQQFNIYEEVDEQFYSHHTISTYNLFYSSSDEDEVIVGSLLELPVDPENAPNLSQYKIATEIRISFNDRQDRQISINSNLRVPDNVEVANRDTYNDVTLELISSDDVTPLDEAEVPVRTDCTIRYNELKKMLFIHSKMDLTYFFRQIDINQVRVKIEERNRGLRQDRTYFCGMVKPTRGFLLHCTYPIGSITEAYCFGIVREEPVIQVGGHIAIIDYNGWLLPGHGGIVIRSN